MHLADHGASRGVLLPGAPDRASIINLS